MPRHPRSHTLSNPSPTPVIELDDLAVRLGRQEVLRGLTATLAGGAVGLLGPNGAGKTTLIHTLLGFHRPHRGRARVLGIDAVGDPDAVKARVGYMPEREAFVPGMSGVRLVRMMAELSGLPPGAALERAHEALRFVGLGEVRYRPVETCSYGMKQLVKLAQALAHGPRLLLLDEPTAGLDPPARRRMLELIRQVAAGGEVKVVISTHLLRDVEECCDEVMILAEGRVAAVSDLAAERQSEERVLTVEMVGEGRDAVLSELAAGGAEWAVAGRLLKLVLPPELPVRELFRLAGEHRVQLRRLEVQRDSLEELFHRALGDLPAAAGPPPPREATG